MVRELEKTDWRYPENMSAHLLIKALTKLEPKILCEKLSLSQMSPWFSGCPRHLRHRGDLRSWGRGLHRHRSHLRPLHADHSGHDRGFNDDDASLSRLHRAQRGHRLPRRLPQVLHVHRAGCRRIQSQRESRRLFQFCRESNPSSPIWGQLKGVVTWD